MNLSVIIPSRNIDNLVPCVEALRRHEPNAQIIVIDDGLAGVIPGAATVLGVKPFCFSRNCNVGIHLAHGDVVLLNDDCLLETPGGFTAMQRAARENPEYGVISAACVHSQPEQQPQSGGLRPVERMVAFYAALIPKRTIAQVGPLDERFVGYGHEDDDYCVRVRRAGLKVGVFDACIVDHGPKQKSTFRSVPDAEIKAKYLENRLLFRMKWGVDAELA